VSVDRRARVDGPLDIVSPDAFLGRALPAAAATHEGLLAPALGWYRPGPLTIACDGGRWTLRHQPGAGSGGDHGRLVVTEGGGGPVLAVTVVQLTELVADLVTPLSWFGDGTLDGLPLDLVLDWWVLLRAALDGVAPYLPGAGDGVTPHRPFGADDDPVAMAAFLESNGYLHLAGVFSAGQMAAVSADIDHVVPPSHGHGRPAWWAVTDGGRDRSVRRVGFEAASGRAGAVLADERLGLLGRLTGDGHTLASYARPGIDAVVRPPGSGDLAWHKDCAFGRHSYDCASLTVGVALTDGERDAGHLRVLAGSHRALLWPAFVRPGTDLPVVDLVTRAGDVTVHLSCTAHTARPPVRAERRTLYTAFGLPPRSPAVSATGDDAAPPSAGVA
jgi:Phytanoyl-CoA dioxygenase (PhyH)